MLQFFVFIRRKIFSNFCWTSLKLRLVKADKVFFARYKYILWPFSELFALVTQTKTRKLLLIFYKFFENVCHFLGFATHKSQGTSSRV